MPDDHPAANCGPGREEGISRADIVGFLLRYNRVVARSTLAGMLLALAYIATTPSIFTARAQLLLDPGLIQNVPRIAGEIQLAMDTPQIESQIAVLRSERIINAALKKLDLLLDPEFVAQGGWLARLTLQGEPTAFETARAIIARVQSGLEVRRVGLSHAIDISFSSRIPDKAASVANAVAEAYVDDQIASRAQAARQGSEWLETRINGLREQMNRAALAVQEFKARRDYRIPPRRDAADGDQKAAVPEPTIGREEQKTLEELESTARTYRSIYESYLQAFTESVQRQTFSISGARVITLATRPLTKSKPKITLALIVGTMLGLLGGLAVAFLKHSIEPTVLSARQVRQVGLKFLGYVLDPERDRERGLVQRLLGRPAGFADSLPGRSRRFLASLLAKVRNGPSSRFQSGDAWPVGCDRGDDFSLALYAPNSPYSESIKTIASSIGLAGGARPVRRVGVMSVPPDASKSALVSNLGILLAGAGNRTLVIDADPNTPVLSRALAPKCSIGLAELLADKAAVDDCVVGAQFNGRPLAALDILPVAGNLPREAGEAAFGAEALRATLQKLEQSYDLILVDMPPARPLMAGASLSSALDEIIIVAARPGTPLQLLTDFAYQLHVAGASHLGVVLSEWGVEPGSMSDADRGRQRVTA
jgi:polysaccharide biosynthesis transport protein